MYKIYPNNKQNGGDPKIVIGLFLIPERVLQARKKGNH
jgi:hypothetical protein